MSAMSSTRLLLSAALRGANPRLALPAAAGQRRSHSGGNNNNNNGKKWAAATAATGVGAAILGGSYLLDHNKLKLKAEVDVNEKEVMDSEHRVRSFGTTKDIFDYFASYQHKDSKGIETTLMSVKDFYNCLVPGSTITHGTGQGTYVRIHDADFAAGKIYEEERLPIPDSVLNKIQREGLITFMDFNFLLNVLSTPWRHLEVAFHSFDVSADGKIEAKEYAHIIAKYALYGEKPKDIVEDRKSGVINYLFGKNRDKTVDKEQFSRFQRDLIHDVLFLEFRRYSPVKGTDNISELDFCKHLLYNANVTSKKKAKMLKRVKEAFAKGPGITFLDFKNFCYILYGGVDLERAIMFRHGLTRGVSREEFQKMALWVANKNISKHVLDVVFTLLDDDEDHKLSVKEFEPVLFQWRHSRGYHRSNFHVSHNQLKSQLMH